MSGIQFTVTLDESEVDAIIQRATEEVRALAAKSLTAQLIAPMVKERVIPQAAERPIKQEGVPVITWDAFHTRVKSQSVTAAALLAQKAEILRYQVNSHLHLRMAKPFAEQFTRQQAKANLLIRIAREFLGEGTKVTIFTSDTEWRELEYTEPQILTTHGQSIATPDVNFIKLIDLINSGSWTYEATKGKSQPAAFLAVNGSIICYQMPRYPGILFLCHMEDSVRNVLGIHPNNTLRKWLKDGLLMLCDKHPTDKKHRFSQNVSVLGKDVTLSRISIARLNDLGLRVNFFRFPGEAV